eukprot:237698-Amphidinium_carterae.2
MELIPLDPGTASDLGFFRVFDTKGSARSTFLVAGRSSESLFLRQLKSQATPAFCWDEALLFGEAQQS